MAVQDVAPTLSAAGGSNPGEIVHPERSARHREPLLTRQRAVHAAIAILRGQGWEALSMRTLARSVDVSLPTLYAAVGSRDELLGDIALDVLSGLAELLTVEQPRQPEDLDSLLCRLAAWGEHQPWFMALVADAPAEVLNAVWEEAGPAAQAIRDRIVGSMGGEMFRDTEPTTLAKALIEAMLTLHRLRRGTCVAPSATGRILRQVLGALVDLAMPAASGEHGDALLPTGRVEQRSAAAV